MVEMVWCCRRYSKPRYLPISKIDNYLSKIDKPFCLIIASTFPHGPYPDSNDYNNQDIFKLPYTGNKVPKYKTGYYQNIREDNSQINDVLNMNVDEAVIFFKDINYIFERIKVWKNRTFWW